jgi:hypothetical protein
MKTARNIVIIALLAFLSTASGSADEGVEREWLSIADGTFKGPSGTLNLAYQGEGVVDVTLTTTRCRVTPSTADAGTVGEQAAVLYAKKGPAKLVIFYEKKYVILVTLDDFSQSFCKGGQDVEGKYRLVQ